MCERTLRTLYVYDTGWGVNRHTARHTSAVSMVSQLRLVVAEDHRIGDKRRPMGL